MPNNVDFITVNGVKIRKGSMGAFISNLNVIESHVCSEDEKRQAWSIITELAPAIRDSGLMQHVAWKNKKLEKLLITR